MATRNRVTSENQINQLEKLDAEQAFQWLFNKQLFPAMSRIKDLLVRSAMDAGKPEIAEQIKREFLELLKSRVEDLLPQAWDEFRQLWPKLQSILREIKDHNLKVIDHHWTTISGVLDSMRERGNFSSQVSNEEILADMLQGDRIVRQFPPGHPLLHLLGIENEGEWNKLTPAQQQVVLFDVLTKEKQPFLRIATGLIHRWAEDSSTNSVSRERMDGDEELETSEAKTSEPHEYLGDADRLSQFCELVGVDMNTLTDGESSRLLDILHALDTGYDFASKHGISMRAYYGNKADSEKTQRQRLFKKIRKASDKAK